MSKFKKRPHWLTTEDASAGGVREGMLPLMRSSVPGVGFLAGKAVLYRRPDGGQLEIFPRTTGNMIRIFIKINLFLLERKWAIFKRDFKSPAWYAREARDYCIIAFNILKEKIKNASNKK